MCQRCTTQNDDASAICMVCGGQRAAGEWANSSPGRPYADPGRPPVGPASPATGFGAPSAPRPSGSGPNTPVLIVVGALAVLLAIGIGVVFGLSRNNESDRARSDQESAQQVSPAGVTPEANAVDTAGTAVAVETTAQSAPAPTAPPATAPTTRPSSAYVSPPPTWGELLVLESSFKHEKSLEQMAQVQASLGGPGRSVEIFDSDHVTGARAGVWIVGVQGYSSRSQARDACAVWGRSPGGGCYTINVVTGKR